MYSQKVMHFEKFSQKFFQPIFWPYEGVAKNYVTLVLRRSHALNLTKKNVFSFFHFGQIWGRNHCGLLIFWLDLPNLKNKQYLPLHVVMFPYVIVMSALQLRYRSYPMDMWSLCQQIFVPGSIRTMSDRSVNHNNVVLPTAFSTTSTTKIIVCRSVIAIFKL